MPISIVWTQDAQPPVTITISDSAEASLTSYMGSLTTLQTVGGVLTSVPVYSSILAMVVGTLTSQLLEVAFNAFPPTEVQSAATAAQTAAAAFVTAQQTFIQSAVTQS
jgi:hypothetical protein